MITTQKTDNQIFTFVIDGDMEQADIDQALNEIKQQAQSGKLRLLGEIRRVDDVDFDNLSGFFRSANEKFKFIGDIAKYAIVTDLDWLRTLAPVGNFLTPGLPIRVFARSEKQQAIDWLNESTDDAYSTGIRPIALSEYPEVVGYAINGKIKSEDYQIINRQLEQAVRQSGKVKFYLEFLHLEGITPAALWEDTKSGLKHAGDIDKVALLGSKDWVENLTEAGDFVTPGIDMEFFELGRKQEALNWLTA